MFRVIPGIVAVVVIPLGLILDSVFVAWASFVAPTLQSEILKLSKTKHWSISSYGQVSYSQVSGITTRIGDQERVLYKVQQSDVGFGNTVVSPTGRRLAFLKTVGDGFDKPVHLKLGVINIDGSDYTELLDVAALLNDMAWSHDDKKLAFIGSLQKGSYRLFVLDVNSLPVRILAERALPSGMSFIDLTSQAWSPDNERLVFVNGAGHMVILNVMSNTEADLGPGDDPTWSRDGAFIAYRAYAFGKPPGDYFIVSLTEPRNTRLILSNKQTIGDVVTLRGPFLGPALWSPDNRFMLIMRLVGLSEYQQPYILEVSTGKAVALPIGSMGDMRSWGGNP